MAYYMRRGVLCPLRVFAWNVTSIAIASMSVASDGWNPSKQRWITPMTGSSTLGGLESSHVMTRLRRICRSVTAS
eukprot:scaffold76333_cov27-Tisochrysis_lutea.AAC.1